MESFLGKLGLDIATGAFAIGIIATGCAGHKTSIRAGTPAQTPTTAAASDSAAPGFGIRSQADAY